jgi:uncharacterized protein involved in exopolysaccharide biosynthesis
MAGRVGADTKGPLRAFMPPNVAATAIPVPARFGIVLTLLEPALLLAFVRDNVRRLAIMFAGLFVAGILLWNLIPAKYAATALVMVDPREQRVAKDPVVLPPYGKDAMALESLVEIAKSDSFLDTLLSRPDFRNIGEFARFGNVAQLMEHMRRALTISRRGLTYVIAVTYTAGSAVDAARVANMIAEAFVQSQGAAHRDVTSDAANWLGDRTRNLREAAQKSDEAVAQYKSERKLAELGDQTTIRQHQAADLARKVAQARLQVEAAEARYNQAQREMAADGHAGLRSELLDTLRLQRVQANDALAQKRATLGERHPEVRVLNRQLTEINRQIERESRSVVSQAKSDRDASRAYLALLENQESKLENDVIAEENAEPELKQRQIEAAANQTIFNQFLARFKLTSELRWLRDAQVSFVSKAEPPHRSTAPPARLIVVVLGFAAVLTSLMVAMVGDRIRHAG